MTLMIFGTVKQLTAILIILAIAIVVLVAFLICCIKKCPSDKIMVVYGSMLKNSSGQPVQAKCFHGGTVLVFPLMQAYQFIDLAPITIRLDKLWVVTRNVPAKVSITFSVGVSTEAGVMQSAAERLLGLQAEEIAEIAKDVIIGMTRVTFAETMLEDVYVAVDVLLDKLSLAVEGEIRKLGLRLLNLNIMDITDEAGLHLVPRRELMQRIANEKALMREIDEQAAASAPHHADDNAVSADAASSKVSEDTASSKVNEDTASSKVSEDTASSKVSEDTASSDDGAGAADPTGDTDDQAATSDSRYYTKRYQKKNYKQ